MALKGQGDPRWIVEERPDGKNVNNWHWTESDFSGWARNRLTEMLKDYKIDTSDISVTITSLTSTGDVSVNTRKQKTFLFYELDVTLKWEGSLKSNEATAKGTIHMPYISEENDDDDFEIKYTVETDSKDAQNIKDKLRTAMNPVLKEKIPQMLKELRDVALGKTNLPQKQAPSNKLDKLEEQVKPEEVKKVVVTTSKPSGPRLVNVTVSEKFMCRPMDLIYCFIDSNRVKAYAGGDATISPQKGSKFSMFGGAVTGEITELDIPNKLQQKWRFSSWPADLYSTVTMTFEEKNGKTILNITHTGIPEEDKERTEGGWKDNFLRRIKGIFGYGALN